MNIVGPFNSGIAAGGAGVATANADISTKVEGTVVAVYVSYKGTTPPSTTDVTITTKGSNPSAPSLTILNVANNNANGWFFPRAQVHLNTTGAAITGVYTEGIPINDVLNVAIAQANNDNNADVWLMVED